MFCVFLMIFLLLTEQALPAVYKTVLRHSVVPGRLPAYRHSPGLITLPRGL